MSSYTDMTTTFEHFRKIIATDIDALAENTNYCYEKLLCPKFSAYNAGTQAVAANTETLMTFPTEEYDDESLWVAGSSYAAIATAGLYHFMACVPIDGSTIAVDTEIKLHLSIYGGASTPGLTYAYSNHNVRFVPAGVNIMVSALVRVTSPTVYVGFYLRSINDAVTVNGGQAEKFAQGRLLCTFD